MYFQIFFMVLHTMENSRTIKRHRNRFSRFRFLTDSEIPQSLFIIYIHFSETENTDYLSSSQNSPGDVISNFVNTIKRSIGRKLPPTPLKSPFSNEMIESYVPKENG